MANLVSLIFSSTFCPSVRITLEKIKTSSNFICKYFNITAKDSFNRQPQLPKTIFINIIRYAVSVQISNCLMNVFFSNLFESRSKNVYILQFVVISLMFLLICKFPFHSSSPSLFLSSLSFSLSLQFICCWRNRAVYPAISPAIWVLLITSLWCHLIWSFVHHISCRLIESEGLIRFQLDLFGQDCLIGHQSVFSH